MTYRYRIDIDGNFHEMPTYVITTDNGDREWQADDADHAIEQHYDCFGHDDPNETVRSVKATSVVARAREAARNMVRKYGDALERLGR